MICFKDKVSSDWPGWIAVFFLVKLIVTIVPLFRGVMIHPDAPVYLWSAQSLEEGNIQGAIEAYPMLLYPFLVMCVHKLGFDWLMAGRLISVVASCLAVFPFYSLARRFSPGWTSLLVTTIFILLPEYNSIAFAALRDPLYICLSLYSLCFASRFIEKPVLKGFIPIILFSVCLPFLRVEGLVVSLVILVWSFIVLIRHLNFSGRVWIIVGVIAFCCVVVSAYISSDTCRHILRLPQIVEYIQKMSSGIPTSVDFYLTKIDDLAHNHVLNGFGNNFWQVIERHWPWIYGIGMLYMFERILGWVFILMGLFGLRDSVKEHKAALLLLAVFVANQLLIVTKYVITGSMEVRIMLFPAIIWLLYSGASFKFIANFVSEKVSWHFFQKKKYVKLLLVVLFILPLSYKTVTKKYNIHIPVLQDSCLWIRDTVLPSEKDWEIMVNLRRMIWFLDKRDTQLNTQKDFSQTRNFLLREGQPTMVILLMSRRRAEDVALMQKLVEMDSIYSKVFTDPGDEKNFVVALWRPIKE